MHLGDSSRSNPADHSTSHAHTCSIIRSKFHPSKASVPFVLSQQPYFCTEFSCTYEAVDHGPAEFMTSRCDANDLAQQSKSPVESIDEEVLERMRERRNAAAVIPDTQGPALLQEQERWMQDLHTFWIASQATTRLPEGGFVLATWFLDFQDHPACLEPRIIVLHLHEFRFWMSQLKRLWADRYSPFEASDFELVSPTPPPPTGFPMVSAHIIMHQSCHLRPEQRAVHFTIQIDQYLDQAAFVLPHRATRDMVLHYAELEDMCLHPDSPHECQVSQGTNQLLPAVAGLEVEFLEVSHGAGFHIRVHTGAQPDDATGFLQISLAQRHLLPRLNNPPFFASDHGTPAVQRHVPLENLNVENEWHTAEASSCGPFPLNDLNLRSDAPQQSHAQQEGSYSLSAGATPALQIQLVNLLTSASPAHPSSPLSVDDVKITTVDLSAVFRLHQQLIDMPLTTWPVWPSDFEMPEACSDVLNMPLWNGERPDSYSLFTDGSYKKQEFVGGSVILVTHHKSCQCLGGVLPLHKPGSNAHAGEAMAMIHALLWAWQLQHWHEIHFGSHIPAIHFGFDALNIGMLAEGRWQGKPFRETTRLLRSLALAVQHYHGADYVSWEHIAAHTGHLWNELADAVASYAESHRDPEHFDHLQALTHHHHIQHFEWLWILRDVCLHKPHLPPLFGQKLIHIHQPPTISDVTFANAQTPTDSTTSVSCSIRLGSANVLALKDQQPGGLPIAGARQLSIMQQFAAAQYHIVGVQETRHRRLLSQSNSHYWVVGHQATDAGHGGVQLWLSKNLPLAHGTRAFMPKDVSLVYGDPEMLIATVKHPLLKATFVVAHAPHSSYEESECAAFWHRISSKLKARRHQFPVFLLADTNGHVGSVTSSAIGDHAASQENKAGKVFHNWMLEAGVFAPSTFSQFHTGVSETCTSPNGASTTRNDYICLEHNFRAVNLSSQVDQTIDLTLSRADHWAVSLQFDFSATQIHRQVTANQVDVQQVTNSLSTHPGRVSFSQHLSHSHWGNSVHCDAIQLSDQTQAFLRTLPKRKSHKRFKRHLQETTWNLISFKKSLFQRLQVLQRALRRQKILLFLRGWHLGQFQAEDQQEVRCLHHNIAWIQWWLAFYSDRAKLAIRNDDRVHFANLAHQAHSAFTREGLQGLWLQLRAVLPKYVKRRLTPKFDIDDELQTQFEQLEAGATVNISTLRHSHLHRKRAEWHQRPAEQVLDLAELPTRYEIEVFSRKQKPHRASGPDLIPPEVAVHGAGVLSSHLRTLAMKCILSETEPLMYKGGRIASLYKGKGAAHEAPSYRGILIAPVYGKILHAWSRHRVLPTLEARMIGGQMGGRSGQQTSTAAHSIRLHIQLAKSVSVSTAIVFIDIKAAFHSMVREFIFNGRTAPDTDFLRSSLSPDDFDIDAIQSELQRRAQESPEDMPPGLRFWLAELHQETWFWSPPVHGEYGQTHVTHTLNKEQDQARQWQTQALTCLLQL